MNTVAKVTQTELLDFLLNVAIVRPVFIWGAPGIGKSSLVQSFAQQLGMPCVSLLGSQLAPEDLIGVPQIVDGKSRFCPPTMIARDDPYCLFLDELNACSHEVQKAFYSLILERRIGEYVLPADSIVIGAGNRSQDNAIVKPMSSALVNRMIHVHLHVSHRDWLGWAYETEIHPLVIQYIETRPDHLWKEPPKHEEPFSTPRAWHMLSDAMYEFGPALNAEVVGVLAFGCLTPSHATQFKAFFKQIHGDFRLEAILKGDMGWPSAPDDRDILYFLSQAFRAHLLKELPQEHKKISRSQNELVYRAKALLKQLAVINLEMAQLVIADTESGDSLPNWFVVEIIRDLPRLVKGGESGKA
jgi:hypothetical protein